MSLLSATLLLFLVLDPLGNIPTFMVILAGVDPRRRRHIIVRELCIALVILVVVLFGGRYVLAAMAISQPAVRIAGGLILLIIALIMIFSDASKIVPPAQQGEPLMVPLAIPLFAGPSTMSTLILLMAQEPHRWPEWLAALCAAWVASTALMLLSGPLSKLLGTRGLSALQSLMGMILTTVAVNMFVEGIRQAVAGG
jgi:multiple antibiotic resistance protein